MKKNLFSNNRKGTKGFCTALGLSAVMIGSACYFAYDQGEKLSRELLEKKAAVQQEKAVDRRVTNVPKNTVPSRSTVTAPAVTAPIVTDTVKAADIVPEEPAEEVMDTVDTVDLPLIPNALNVGITRLENPKPPLADISNVIAPFSNGELVKSETTGSWQTHNGTDIAAEEGAEVYAVSNGEIKSIEKNAVWGVTVVLDHHNGFVTKYCGLSPDLQVQEGQMLVSGNTIGTVGNTADIESSLPSHLHIEITHHGSYIDPMETFS